MHVLSPLVTTESEYMMLGFAVVMFCKYYVIMHSNTSKLFIAAVTMR